MHRDLKPHNLLLDEDMNIKIVYPFLFVEIFRLILGTQKSKMRNNQRKLKSRMISTITTKGKAHL